MPKRLDNIFYDKLNFNNLLQAYERSIKKKRKCKEVIQYGLDLVNYIMTTMRELEEGSYEVGKYRQFEIYEPKKRMIQSLPFKDRIVQQWYVEEFIKPIFIPTFIIDSYACLEGRGVHNGVRKLNRYMYNYGKKYPDMYILKCDISKFFYSIHKQKLYSLIKRKVKDKDFLNLTRMLIYHDKNPVGIPIGNYTSQYFANIYLNTLDHYVKEKMKVKCYVRYMDDFILLLENKEKAKQALAEIREFLEKELQLKLNQKTNYFKAKQGVNFCGYKITQKGILLKKENKKKIYKKVKIWNKLYEEKKLNLAHTAMRLNSWKGHAGNADTYHLIRYVEKNCKWLYNAQTDNLNG